MRPATQDDLRAYYGADRKITQTVTAFVGLVGDQVVGVGGLAHMDGFVFGFLDVGEAARKQKVALVKAARKFIKDVRADGYRYIYAACDTSEKNAPKLLKGLGFIPMDDGTNNWRWSAE